MGGTYDALGQLYQRKPGEEYRFGQTAFAAVTGAVAVPLSGTSVIGDAMLGGIVGGTNTYATNEMYGRDDDVKAAFGWGFGFGGLGNIVGKRATDISLQFHPNLSQSYRNYIEQGVSSRIGAIPSFLPLPEAKKGDSK